MSFKITKSAWLFDTMKHYSEFSLSDMIFIDSKFEISNTLLKEIPK